MIRKYLIIFLLPLAAASVAVAQPKLAVVGPKSIDVGNIYDTAVPVPASYMIKNVGTAPLHITQVSTSCGCTVAVLADSVLMPGQETLITVQFNPLGYIGEVTKRIYVVSDDPDVHMTTLELHVHVSYLLQATPSFLLFQYAKVGKLDSASVTLSNTSGDTLEITGVVSESPELTFMMAKKTLHPGENGDLEVYVRGEKVGPLSGVIRIRTSSQAEPELVLRYYAGILP